LEIKWVHVVRVISELTRTALYETTSWTFYVFPKVIEMSIKTVYTRICVSKIHIRGEQINV